MGAFRLLLVVFFLNIGVYTIFVGVHHGMNLLSVFFENIMEVTWSGQFNLDFMSYLGLSGMWIAWRHHFSPKGLLLAAIAAVAGMLFLAPYLLVASFETKGNTTEMLIGKERANA